MRTISAALITETVCNLAVKANLSLREDVLDALRRAHRLEANRLAKEMFKVLLDNARIAKTRSIAICQDTGMAVVFCRLGRKVRVDADITKAINEGIRIAYKKAFFRKSVVSDPLIRKNTDTNTPAIIHYDIDNSDKVRLTVLPKGFGSENASRMAMLRPTDTEDDIVDLVVATVKAAGPNACPPFVLGVGIGGTLDKAALLAKEATLRPIDKPNPKRHLLKLERKILEKVNATGIGPAGLGGRTTCLGVNILTFPTHIAGLPVCVNITCHAMRSASRTI